MEEKLFKAYINPLAFLVVDEPWALMDKTEVTQEHILEYMCPTSSHEIPVLIKNYKKISVEERRLNVVPAEDRILEKLIWPLRHAKASYMVENYLGTISLCGMVAEMVAILFFDISQIKLKNKIIDSEKQNELFGGTFEKLGQDKRVKILKAYEIIDSDIKNKFDFIRITRRRYLHLWSQDHGRLTTDAIETFKKTESLVVDIIGQDLDSDGRFLLNPAIVKYLEKHGQFEPEKEE